VSPFPFLIYHLCLKNSMPLKRVPAHPVKFALSSIFEYVNSKIAFFSFLKRENR
jgi:hypothetical protein